MWCTICCRSEHVYIYSFVPYRSIRLLPAISISYTWNYVFSKWFSISFLYSLVRPNNPLSTSTINTYGTPQIRIVWRIDFFLIFYFEQSYLLAVLPPDREVRHPVRTIGRWGGSDVCCDECIRYGGCMCYHRWGCVPVWSPQSVQKPQRRRQKG